MNPNIRKRTARAWLAAPALASTLFSAVLTVAVVALWLGSVMPVLLAVVIGLGFDGAWLSALAYERRLASQGDHDRRVTALGWLFGLAATGVLVAHALTTANPAGWLAVAWLPLAAKSLWWLHSLWEATEISPRARVEISRVLQEARDSAAIARASLNAQTRVERVRMETLSTAGAMVAKVQAKSARALAGAWSELEGVDQEEENTRALATVAAPALRWDLPVWTPVAAVRPEALAVPAGGSAEIRPESAPKQVSAAPVAADPLPETPGLPEHLTLAADLIKAVARERVPEQSKSPSVAAAVRSLVAEGVTDPKAVSARLPELIGRTPNPQTVAREIRNAKASNAKPGTGFGFAAGRN